MGSAVVQFEIVGRDGERLREFYGRLFDWQFEHADPIDAGAVRRDGNTNADGVGIGGGVGSAMPGSDGHVTVYVEITDIAALLRRVEELGGTRLWGPLHTAAADLGQFTDPEGHLIGLITTPTTCTIHPASTNDHEGEGAMTMAIETSTVTSSDGTSIEYDRSGTGPALVIIGAGPTDRSVNAPVAELLATTFTVYNYDRRARGGSGDTQPYSVDREYDDLAAVIDAAGGSAAVYGTSGGAVVALEAAARGLAITKLGLWEPPFYLDDEPVRPPADYEARLQAAVDAGRPGDAVELFFTLAAGMPAEFVAPMRDMPFWPAMEDLAQALIYDAKQLGDFRPRPQRLAQVTIPALVIDGGTVPSMTRAADAIAPLLPKGQRTTLAGQPHNVDAAAIAPVLAEFLAD